LGKKERKKEGRNRFSNKGQQSIIWLNSKEILFSFDFCLFFWMNIVSFSLYVYFVDILLLLCIDDARQ
jgi:hypothetical protein